MSEKRDLYEYCQTILRDKIDSLSLNIAAIQTSANQETKSSMGDKYETSRAMAMIEKEQLASQLEAFLKQKKVLDQISKDDSEVVGLGSLVITSTGLRIYVSISLGKLNFLDKEYLVISPVAPLGKSLKGLLAGSTYNFQNRTHTIDTIL